MGEAARSIDMRRLLSFFLGGGLGGIAKEIAEWDIKRREAENDEARVYAEQVIAQLKAREAILVEETKHAATRWIRPAIAAPFVIYLWKLVVWDKVLGMGATDNLSPELWHLMWIVIGAYFVTRPFEKWRKR